MTSNSIGAATNDDVQLAARFSVARWVWANALGLAVFFGLFGSAGSAMEALGAEHDSVLWGVPTLAAMVAGGAGFALLRRRALGSPQRSPRWHPLAIGASATAAFVVGSFLPPIDFAMAVVAAGTIGAALQLGALRRGLNRSRGLVPVTLGAWLVGALAAGAAVFLLDGILKNVFDLSHGFDTTGMFIGLNLLVGLTGGAIGGAIEGAAIRSRLARSE